MSDIPTNSGDPEGATAERVKLGEKLTELLERGNKQHSLVVEGVGTLAKAVLLANGGGLTLAISQLGTSLDHHHSGLTYLGVPLWLFPLWSFGIGTLLSGLRLTTSYAAPMITLAATAAEIDDILRSLGKPPAFGSVQRTRTRTYLRSAMIRIDGALLGLSEGAFAVGLIAGLVEISSL